jgi:hypothetical protein
MFRYQNNAFRILGLKPNVSMREIMKRVNEIKVKISLGMEIVYEYDFSWMGTLDRNEHSIINALQRLENPISRLKEEIFWFWFETDCDKKAINYLKKNNYRAAHKTWNKLISSENPTKESMSAFMNQIILAHSSVIREECEEKEKNQKKKNATLNEKHWENWKFVITQFTLIASNKVYWEMVKDKAEKIDDPRLSSSKVDEIYNNFLQDIAKPNFTFMRDALILKDYERVKQHSSLLSKGCIPNKSPFPSEVLRKGFNRILSSQTDLLKRHAQNSEKELNRVEKGEKDADKTIISIYSKLIDNVRTIIYEGDLVDSNSISDFALAKNELAKVIRNCAIALNNILVEDNNLPQEEEGNEAFQAFKMIRKALECATTIYVRQKYEKDEELLKNNLITVQANIKYKKHISSKAKRKSIFAFLFWGAIILYFVIIPMFNNSSSSSKPPTSTSSYNSNADYDKAHYSLDQLKIRIENLEEEIDKKERKGLELKSWFKTEEERLGALKSEMEQLDIRIENTIVGKDSLIDDYNQKVKEYNDLFSSYENIYLEYDRLFDDYEKDIITHDSLVESYNAGIIPPWIQNQLSEEEGSDKIYVVKAGDNLWKIAEKFGTTTEEIIALNKLSDSRLIKPGQKLIIPQNNN